MSRNRILIVEDDNAISQMITLNLRAVGYEYNAFDNGQDSADHLKSDHAYDLVLLDIMLPGLNGFQLLTRLGLNHYVCTYTPAVSFIDHDPDTYYESGEQVPFGAPIDSGYDLTFSPRLPESPLPF